MKRCAVFLLFLFVSSASLAAVEVQMVSDNGDYIGAGQIYSLSENNGTFTVSSNVGLVSVSYQATATSDNWNLEFKAPDVITVGPYFEALRYPFQGPANPGMSVSGNGRGCNQLTGHFVISELELSATTINTLALDFVQYCDGSASALRGGIRINSLIPAPNPNVVAYAGKNAKVGENTQVTLDASQSYSPGGLGLTYQWQQISGQSVSIIDDTLPVVEFVSPQRVMLGGEDLVFEVTVADTSGGQSTDTVTVHINSKSDPQTYLIFHSEAGDYIGAGRDWFYDEAAAVFNLGGNYDNGVTININANEFWTLDFAAPTNEPLQAGIYLAATRFPFQVSESPGLSVSGAGRGCNQLTGQFEVLQIVGSVVNPERFAATFEQHCEGGTPALNGEVYVNALDPSVPVANAGTDKTVAENTLITLNGSDSYDSDGSLVSYLWTQVTGPSVSLSNNTDIRPSFTTPALGDRQLVDSLRFELLVEDDQGFMKKSSVIITVTQQNTAPVASDDQVKVQQDSSIDVAVLLNDTDLDGQLNLASIELVALPSHGLAVIKSNGTVEYTPAVGYLGADSFTYTVKDNDGSQSNIAVAAIEVQLEAVNDTPSNSSGGGSTSVIFALIMLLIYLFRRRSDQKQGREQHQAC